MSISGQSLQTYRRPTVEKQRLVEASKSDLAAVLRAEAKLHREKFFGVCFQDPLNVVVAVENIEEGR